MRMYESNSGAIAPDALIGIRPVGIDDFAQVRYTHTTSFRVKMASYLAEEEVDAYSERINSPAYTAQLMREDLLGAWIDRELVGTCGWTPMDSGKVARITSVFVRPPFAGLGIGRRLVIGTEERARANGFRNFSVRATGIAVPFFERLGYTVTSHGLRNLGVDRGLPVTFMRKMVEGEPRVGFAETEAEPLLT